MTVRGRRHGRITAALGAALLVALIPAAAGAPMASGQDDGAMPDTTTATSTGTTADDAPDTSTDPADDTSSPVPPPTTPRPTSPRPTSTTQSPTAPAPVHAPSSTAPETGGTAGEETSASSSNAPDRSPARPGAAIGAPRPTEPGAPASRIREQCRAKDLWVTNRNGARRILPDGSFTDTPFDLAHPGQIPGASNGSAVAADPTGKWLYGATIGDRDRITIPRWDARTGAFDRAVTATDINADDLRGPHGPGRILTAASTTHDGRHLLVGGAGNAKIWRINVDDGRAELIAEPTEPQITGWGGDFVTMPEGETLGATSTGELVWWAGQPGSGPTRFAGRVAFPDGAEMTKIAGVAVVDGVVHVIDGGTRRPRVSEGVFRLPPEFGADLAAQHAGVIHPAALVLGADKLGTDGFGLDGGIWNLASTQESDPCPPVGGERTFGVGHAPAPDQDPATAGAQPDATISPAGTVTAYYDVAIANNSEGSAIPGAPVTGRITLPDGLRVNTITALHGSAVAAKSTDGTYEIPADAIGAIPGRGTATIRVRVIATADEAARAAIGRRDPAYACAPDSPTGMIASVAMGGGGADGGGPEAHACVNPT